MTGTRAPVAPAPRPRGWLVRDAEGHQIGRSWASRGDAVRQLGALALRGAWLPLIVYAPSGLPSGDRLG